MHSSHVFCDDALVIQTLIVGAAAATACVVVVIMSSTILHSAVHHNTTYTSLESTCVYQTLFSDPPPNSVSHPTCAYVQTLFPDPPPIPLFLTQLAPTCKRFSQILTKPTLFHPTCASVDVNAKASKACIATWSNAFIRFTTPTFTLPRGAPLNERNGVRFNDTQGPSDTDMISK